MAVTTTDGNISNLVSVAKMTMCIGFVNLCTGSFDINVFNIKNITVEIRIFTFAHCMCINSLQIWKTS